MKATIENPRGIVKKLFTKESVQGANPVLRGSVRALEGFSKDKPEAEKTGDMGEGFPPKQYCCFI